MKYSMRPFGRLTTFLLPLSLLLAACNALENTPRVEVTPSPAVTLTPEAVAPQATSEVTNAPQESPANSPLRLWVPPEIGARTQAGAQELMSQVLSYQASHPDLELLIEQKPVDGAGGILNYLQTGREVAPSVMPDLVAVPTALLADPRYQDLFFPLDGLVDPGFIDDVYQAAAEQVADGDTTLGYPFATVGLTHLVYDPDVITSTIPLNWTRFISDTDHTLVLPADSREGAMLGLQFYLAEGGRLVDESGQAILETEPLSRALSTIAINKTNLLQSHQLKTLDEAWQYHQLGLSDFMWTRAEYLLGRQAADPAIIATQSYANVPGLSGALIPLTTDWAWAITSNDPTRQTQAADLIQFLAAPENLSVWSELSQVLPARRSTMSLLGETNPYYEFASGQLDRAQPMPINEASRLMDVLGDAVFQALTTDQSPVLIAEEAATALRQ